MARLHTPPGVSTVDVPPLDSVLGLDAARRWGTDLKVDLIAYRAGGIPFSAIDAGAVLAGPPGTGKTMVARIIANDCGLAFVQTSIADRFAASDGHLDGVIKKSRSVFDEARSKKPALLFIDELDALPSRDRMDAHDRSWWTPVITDFLVQLDSSLADRTGIIVLGATNRYADLDSALVRPGRLSRLLQIEPPSVEALEGIFRHHLGGDLIDQDLVPLATLVKGATGAAVAEWANTARRAARNAGRLVVLQDLWDAAIGRDGRSHAVLWRVAVHEAGHCVLGHLLGRKPIFVTLRSVGDMAGHTRFEDGAVVTRGDLERAAIVILGGQAAEHALLASDVALGIGGDRGSDLHLATEIVAAGYASYGWGDTPVWRADPRSATSLLSMDRAFLAAVGADLRRYAETAARLVSENADLCRSLAEMLMSKSSLTRDELGHFFSQVQT